jgi:hypothetical protein
MYNVDIPIDIISILRSDISVGRNTSFIVRPEISKWLSENVGYTVKIEQGSGKDIVIYEHRSNGFPTGEISVVGSETTNVTFYVTFQNESDAMAFKLRWL